MNSKNYIRIILVIFLIITIIFSTFFYLNKSEIVTLTKHKHIGEMYSELYSNDKNVEYTDDSVGRELLTGGPFHFGELIKSGDVFVQLESCGYVEGLDNAKYVDLEGNKIEQQAKYALFHVVVKNNSKNTIPLTLESFAMGYSSSNTIISTILPNNSKWGKIDKSFAIKDLLPYTERSGYIYFPINEIKLKDLFVKVDVGNVPIIFTK